MIGLELSAHVFTSRLQWRNNEGREIYSSPTKTKTSAIKYELFWGYFIFCFSGSSTFAYLILTFCYGHRSGSGSATRPCQQGQQLFVWRIAHLSNISTSHGGWTVNSNESKFVITSGHSREYYFYPHYPHVSRPLQDQKRMSFSFFSMF